MKRVVQKVTCGGDCFTDTIVKAMWRLSNRDSKNPVIIKRAKSLKGKTLNESIRNIFNYTVRKVPYVSDPDGYEEITAPIHLEQGTKTDKYGNKVDGGDCDCQVTFITSLLSAIGIKSRIITLAWRREEFTHVILEAFDGKKWIILDPTKGFAGFGKTIPKSEDLVKRRIKKYGNPMTDIVTLEDCGCRSNSNLSDCGCKGRCGGKGGCGKGRPKNYNNNVTNVNIGNDIAESLNLKLDHRNNQSSGKAISRNGTPVIDNSTGETKRLLHKKTGMFRKTRKTFVVKQRPWY